ncbi:MAG: cupin-like domain-containing protein [Saprospiraceae bacterium]|nr:cupin-like domain-containing protein [Saprospiraceae bacterium]
MELKAVDRRTGLTRESFKAEYLDTRRPVVFTDLMQDWPARTKWSIGYLKEKYGHIQVPVYSENYSKPGKGYMAPDKVIPFREYLQLLEAGPCSWRLFLFNIFRHAPSMCEDFRIPTIMDGFYREFPFMFFGGQGSRVALHFDIDLAHVFLNQIHGRKRVVLFSPEQSRLLYHHPFTVASYIDVNNPDYDKYPALRKVHGFETILEPGETIFMPCGYWHYIEYTDGGYSMALRANESYVRRAKGALNIARHFVVDKGMNKLMGTSWREMKAEIARRRAEALIQTP